MIHWVSFSSLSNEVVFWESLRNWAAIHQVKTSWKSALARSARFPSYSHTTFMTWFFYLSAAFILLGLIGIFARTSKRHTTPPYGKAGTVLLGLGLIAFLVGLGLAKWLWLRLAVQAIPALFWHVWFANPWSKRSALFMVSFPHGLQYAKLCVQLLHVCVIFAVSGFQILDKTVQVVDFLAHRNFLRCWEWWQLEGEMQWRTSTTSMYKIAEKPTVWSHLFDRTSNAFGFDEVMFPTRPTSL